MSNSTRPSTSHRFRRGLLFGAILLFWLTMTGLLLYRERAAPRVDPRLAGGERLEEPIESWMGLFVGQSRVGYVHLLQLPETRRGVEGASTRVATRVALELFGRETRLDLTGAAWRPFEEERAELEFEVRSGDYDFRLEGTLEQGRLRGRVFSAGEVLPLDVPAGDDMLWSAGFGSSVTFPKLDPGDRVTLPSFDPMTLRATEVEVRCVAREVLLIAGEKIPTRVLVIDSGGLENRAWVDDEGAVVRAVTPIGFALERISAEEALLPTAADVGSDFLGLTAIVPSGARPFRGARQMSFRISDAPEGGLPVDDLQLREGNRYRRITTPQDAGEIDVEPYLAADAFVQSTHPKIVEASRAILQGAPADHWQRALRLHDWVYSEISKEAALSIPSALEVLAQRRGDCNEHTVLYTALARAAGLPSRIAIGLVWSEDLDGFYYHAWPEVLVDGAWRWIDPTLGQPTADATHIKLLQGGIETWSQLLPYLGRLKIEVEEVS